MKVRLGYVAIPVTLECESSFRTMTYTRYCQLGKEANTKLDEIIRENLVRLRHILQYNLQNQIYFYRMSHNIVPLATMKEVQFDYITPYQKEWKEIGDFINKHHMRVDTHPDQFCVLNSEHLHVIESSIELLDFQTKLFDAMGINGLSVIHIGGGILEKKEALKRFEETFMKLPPQIQKIIILENDDRIFNAKETLELCEKLKIPMVLDYHHHICNRSKEKIETYIDRILNTWKEKDLPPKIHLSSAKSRKERRSHSDYIKEVDFFRLLELLKISSYDLDIMLECKKKEEAVLRLARQLRFYTNIKFNTNTTFIIPDKIKKKNL